MRVMKWDEPPQHMPLHASHIVDHFKKTWSKNMLKKCMHVWVWKRITKHLPGTPRNKVNPQQNKSVSVHWHHSQTPIPRLVNHFFRWGPFFLRSMGALSCRNAIHVSFAISLDRLFSEAKRARPTESWYASRAKTLKGLLPLQLRNQSKQKV